MKNLFFIFLISIFFFSCNKENNSPKFFDSNTPHYIKSVIDGDSLNQYIGNEWASRFYIDLEHSSEFEYAPDNSINGVPGGNGGVLGRTIGIMMIPFLRDQSKPEDVPCQIRKEYIKVGKYPFGRSGNYFYPYDTPNSGIKDGVELSFREANVGYGMDKQWLSSMLPQPKESYFEITEVVPDAINPDLLHVKARFSCLLGRMKLQQDVIKTFSGEMKGVVICTGK